MPPPTKPPRRMLFDVPATMGHKEGSKLDPCLHAYDDFSNPKAGRQKAGGKRPKEPYKNPVD